MTDKQQSLKYNTLIQHYKQNPVLIFRPLNGHQNPQKYILKHFQLSIVSTIIPSISIILRWYLFLFVGCCKSVIKVSTSVFISVYDLASFAMSFLLAFLLPPWYIIIPQILELQKIHIILRFPACNNKLCQVKLHVQSKECFQTLDKIILVLEYKIC